MYGTNDKMTGNNTSHGNCKGLAALIYIELYKTE